MLPHKAHALNYMTNQFLTVHESFSIYVILYVTVTYFRL